MAETIINLAGLFSGEKSTKSLSFSLDMSEIDINGNKPFYEAIEVKAELISKDSFVLLELDATCPFRYPCDRCAEIIDKSLNYHFTHKIVESLNEGNNDYYIVTEDDYINLTSLVREDILLELPTKILCKEDCKGLCPVCGQNLNLGSCSCNVKVTDPRWDKLKELLV